MIFFSFFALWMTRMWLLSELPDDLREHIFTHHFRNALRLRMAQVRRTCCLKKKMIQELHTLFHFVNGSTDLALWLLRMIR